MIRSFTTFALGPKDAAIVFPLVQAVMPKLDLAAWQRFARPLVDQPAPSPQGAIGLRNAAGYVCGVLTYRAERDLQCGAVLSIDLFTVLDLVSEQSAIDSLLQAAELKARELDCAAIHIHLDQAQESIAGRVRRAGYRTAAIRHCKNVATAPPPS